MKDFFYRLVDRAEPFAPLIYVALFLAGVLLMYWLGFTNGGAK